MTDAIRTLIPSNTSFKQLRPAHESLQKRDRTLVAMRIASGLLLTIGSRRNEGQMVQIARKLRDADAMLNANNDELLAIEANASTYLC